MTARASDRRTFGALRRSRFGRGLAWIARFESVAILVIAVIQLAPRSGRTAWALLAIPVLWLVRWLAWGRITVRTPLDVPLLILVAMAPVSLLATFDCERSLEGVSSLLLGVALAYAIANSIRTVRALWVAMGTFLAIIVALAAVSLTLTRWPAGKLPGPSALLGPLYARLPSAVSAVPLVGPGFNPNAIGGVAVLFMVLFASLLLGQFRSPRSGVCWWFNTLAWAGALVLMAFVLLLTQSRQAYVAALLALVALMAFQGRWPRVGAIVLLVAAAGLVARNGLADTAQAVFGVRDVESLAASASWVGRVEIWNRALRVIQDHPLTGIGFGTFFPVSHARYTMFLFAPGADLVHAHNLFLQAALDLGLPGLVGFVWLWIAFGRMLVRVWRSSGVPSHRALAAGLLCGVLAQVLFGLGDAMPLGHPVALLTWFVVGLGAALWVLEARCPETQAVA